MPHRRASLALAFLLVAPGALAQRAAAQGAAIAAGARVRITTDSAPAWPVVGSLLSATRDSVRVRLLPSSEPTSLANERIQTLAVSAGRHGHAVQGLIIGSASGLVIGAVGGYASGDDPPQTFMGMTKGEKARLAAAVLGVVGAGAGALIGHFVKTEEWRTVALPVQVSIAPTGRGGITAGFTLR